MTKENFDYEVRCKTCFEKFTVQLFEGHEKNLFLVDKKDWYCDPCKQDYFKQLTSKLTDSHTKMGFPELTGSAKRISWAEKIRAELLNKVDFFKKSLIFNDDEEKEKSDTAFDIFLSEWQKEEEAKWWVDHRRTNIREISIRINEIKETIQ